MKEQNIEKLFKDSFSNFEADVNPSMWANIEQGLPSAPQGSTPVAKPSGFFSKMGMNTIILATAISGALIGTGMYLSSQKSGSPDATVQTVRSEQQVAQNNTVVPSQTTPQVLTDAASTAPLNVQGNEIKAAEKQPSKKSAEQVITTLPSSQHSPVAEKKTESASNSNGLEVSKEAGATSSEPAKVFEKGRLTHKLDKTTEHAVAENTHAEGGKTNVNTSVTASTPAENNPVVEGGSEPVVQSSEEQFKYFLPNVFTPNGDMLNDYYKPVINTNVKYYEMTIYDRYGFEIFKTKDVEYGWDGKLKDGNMAASAVYVVILKITDPDDVEYNKIRSFTLLK